MSKIETTKPKPDPELLIQFWPFKLFAKGNYAIQAVRWPLRCFLVVTAASISIAIMAGIWFGKPWKLGVMLVNMIG